MSRTVGGWAGVDHTKSVTAINQLQPSLNIRGDKEKEGSCKEVSVNHLPIL